MRRLEIVLATGMIFFLISMLGVVLPSIISSGEFPLWSILLIVIFGTIGFVVVLVYLIMFVFNAIQKEIDNDSRKPVSK